MEIRPLAALAACIALVGATPAAHAAIQGFDLKRPEIRRFVREVARRDALSRRRILRLLARAHPQPQIIDQMNRPPERVLQWWEYRQIFLTPKRIDAGVQFWLEHRAVLERVASEQGVPPEYLVAILGCETLYGRQTGSDRVLDTLATLAFDYPPRERYFRGELEQFLLLVREDHLNPLAVKGSYSGAMGAPQFMPSTYRRYAVDESHDHRPNLWDDWADVFASIANYLRQNGWQPGEPVLAEARLDPDPSFQLDAHGVVTGTLDELNAQGVHVSLALPGTTPALLVSSQEADGPAYHVAFGNFRAIMRYNRSVLYAMAVDELARSIAERVHETPPVERATQATAGAPPT